MQELISSQQHEKFSQGGIKLTPILAIWAIVFLIGMVFLIFSSDENGTAQLYFLIPWVLLLGVVISLPFIFYLYRGEFKIYNPLIYAASSYFIPAFVLGGFILSNGWSQPYFLTLIQDPQNDLPFTLIIVILGFLGLVVGFFTPLGKIAGTKLGNILPIWNWDTDKLFTATYILLAIGFVNTVFGYVSGVLGYQKIEEGGIFDGLLFLLTLMWVEATFLLWLIIFRRGKRDYKTIFSVVFILLFSLIKVLYAGNRGGLFSVFMLVMLAYFISGRKLSFKQGILGTVLLICSLLIGMIYGTTFRNIKESESRVGMEQYTENIFATFDAVVERDNLKSLEQGLSSIAERLDAVSSLAVVVSNYEQLAPYEESYGLDNNISKDIFTFIIPRVLWNDKPLASEPRKYSELYFNFGENSFTITPMGDLIRNFGVYGVFIGMLILGIILRFIYSALIENREFSYWRSVLYFMMLTSISYENFYGGIISYLTKVGIIAIIGIIIVNFVVKKQTVRS